jgi:enamine deaminase RidA (YjgF/YER057c/UK114 family)
MSKLPLPVNPPDWPRPSGYSNAMIGSGRVIALAGQVGWDPKTRQFPSDDLVVQLRQTLINILESLRVAGAGREEIIRLTWFITDKQAYVSRLKEVGAVYREIMGHHFPAMSVLVVSELIEDRAKVEIEATALLPQ